MKSPYISVVMPTYNTEKYINEAVQSILNQSFDDFEFIIIDDGSKDRTVNIIKSFDDKRIKFISKKTNQGNYACRNEGCKFAKGKYIAVMDSDDIAIKNRFEEQVSILDNDTDLLAIGTYFNIIDNNLIGVKPSTYPYIKLSLLDDNMFLHPSLMIRKAVLEDINYYNLDYKYSSDYDLVCRLALKGKIENIPQILMNYRIHEQQISTAKYHQQREYANQIRINYIKGLGFNLSEKDLQIFTLMMTKSTLTVQQIKKIEKVIQKIKMQNSILECFNEKQFNTYMDISLSKCYKKLRV